NEKVKQSIRSPIHDDNSVGNVDDIQKRSIGYVSIVSLSSTVPTESTDNTTATSNTTMTLPKFGLSTKRHHHHHHRVGDLG
ncbi:unnamed protein product, partial [Rotaria magnacalcarata]